jgi:hypothetical protein
VSTPLATLCPGVHETKEDLLTAYTSPSFERVWGLRLADLYQNPRLWMETIHPEDRARVGSIFSEWIAGADVSYQDVEFRIVQQATESGLR